MHAAVVVAVLAAVSTADDVRAPGWQEPDTVWVAFASPPRVDPATLAAAIEVAERLLASAGLRVERDDVERRSAGTPGAFVAVRILPAVKPTSPEVCGEIVQDAHTRQRYVLVYLERIVQVAAAVRATATGPSREALLATSTGHLLGLTLAHELGHVLGLGHTAAGVMKAHPGQEEILQLLRSRLAFERGQGAQMRQALRLLHGAHQQAVRLPRQGTVRP